MGQDYLNSCDFLFTYMSFCCVFLKKTSFVVLIESYLMWLRCHLLHTIFHAYYCNTTWLLLRFCVRKVEPHKKCPNSEFPLVCFFLTVFGLNIEILNTGKYGREKIQIVTIFKQCWESDVKRLKVFKKSFQSLFFFNKHIKNLNISTTKIIGSHLFRTLWNIYHKCFKNRLLFLQKVA